MMPVNFDLRKLSDSTIAKLLETDFTDEAAGPFVRAVQGGLLDEQLHRFALKLGKAGPPCCIRLPLLEPQEILEAHKNLLLAKATFEWRAFQCDGEDAQKQELSVLVEFCGALGIALMELARSLAVATAGAPN